PRSILTTPAPLLTERDANGNVFGGGKQGMLDLVVDQLKLDKGNAEILRNDTVNIADMPVGMVAARYQAADGARLTQRAIVQASELLYFTLDFTTPAAKTGEAADDPQVKEAVAVFSKVLDSVRLLDQTKVI